MREGRGPVVAGRAGLRGEVRFGTVVIFRRRMRLGLDPKRAHDKALPALRALGPGIKPSVSAPGQAQSGGITTCQ